MTAPVRNRHSVFTSVQLHHEQVLLEEDKAIQSHHIPLLIPFVETLPKSLHRAVFPGLNHDTTFEFADPTCWPLATTTTESSEPPNPRSQKQAPSGLVSFPPSLHPSFSLQRKGDGSRIGCRSAHELLTIPDIDVSLKSSFRPPIFLASTLCSVLCQISMSTQPATTTLRVLLSPLVFGCLPLSWAPQATAVQQIVAFSGTELSIYDLQEPGSFLEDFLVQVTCRPCRILAALVKQALTSPPLHRAKMNSPLAGWHFPSITGNHRPRSVQNVSSLSVYETDDAAWGSNHGPDGTDLARSGKRQSALWLSNLLLGLAGTTTDVQADAFFRLPLITRCPRLVYINSQYTCNDAFFMDSRYT
ncbi:hypothetical protein SODALDRAFT_376091 [Sodiomyces alkalinus F11]|uniref:Uncharacterized protein n=1 Tax=Sodiomyces alkalinus (strain CBS 110278 / VKM F-3762 / F11) TaxID=1314773 RepID=A0A3N2Q0M8_SODAK|nr:hypothetical protein SODALDRAFT_376091 [Sodiomyces alkalinus F11]ROT40302.1 hypothetical protein SODALDRAFT_376091 [Sodiomyces alkalinus F11]